MRDKAGPIAIVAGSGSLPLELMGHFAALKQPFRLLAFRGFASLELRSQADRVCDLLDAETILSTLDGWRPAAVTIVGGVDRPGLPALLGAVNAFRNRHQLRDVLARGDDHLLRAAVRLLEERGHRIVGVHELAPHLLASARFAGGRPLAADERASVDMALDLLAALAPFDIGQAAVIADRRVLAIEGPEGTDRMLRRVGTLRRSWRGRRGEGGVLVKAAKHEQDLRVDLPAIGPRTVVEAARAGLAGIAIGAGSTLVLDRAETLWQAERNSVFIVSVALPWMSDAR